MEPAMTLEQLLVQPYRELQRLAKSAGMRANIPRKKLIEQLVTRPTATPSDDAAPRAGLSAHPEPQTLPASPQRQASSILELDVPTPHAHQHRNKEPLSVQSPSSVIEAETSLSMPIGKEGYYRSSAPAPETPRVSFLHRTHDTLSTPHSPMVTPRLEEPEPREQNREAAAIEVEDPGSCNWSTAVDSSPTSERYEPGARDDSDKENEWSPPSPNSETHQTHFPHPLNYESSRENSPVPAPSSSGYLRRAVESMQSMHRFHLIQTHKTRKTNREMKRELMEARLTRRLLHQERAHITRMIQYATYYRPIPEEWPIEDVWGYPMVMRRNKDTGLWEEPDSDEWPTDREDLPREWWAEDDESYTSVGQDALRAQAEDDTHRLADQGTVLVPDSRPPSPKNKASYIARASQPSNQRASSSGTGRLEVPPFQDIDELPTHPSFGTLWTSSPPASRPMTPPHSPLQTLPIPRQPAVPNPNNNPNKRRASSPDHPDYPDRPLYPSKRRRLSGIFQDSGDCSAEFLPIPADVIDRLERALAIYLPQPMITVTDEAFEDHIDTTTIETLLEGNDDDDDDDGVYADDEEDDDDDDEADEGPILPAEFATQRQMLSTIAEEEGQTSARESPNEGACRFESPEQGASADGLQSPSMDDVPLFGPGAHRRRLGRPALFSKKRT